MAATKETLAKLEKQISGGTTKAPTVTLAKKTTGSGTSGSKTTNATTGKTTKSSTNTVAEIEKQIVNGTTTAPTVKTSTKKAGSVPEKAMDTTSTAYYQNQIDSADRLYNILTSTVKDIGAAASQIGGAVVEGAGRLNKSLEDSRNANIAAYEADQTAKAKAQLASGKNEKGEALTGEETYRLNKIVARNTKMPSVRETTSKNILSNTLDTASKAYSAADTLQAQSSQDMAEAKEGLGKVGSFAVDVGKAAASMAGDAALSAVAPGAGLVAMGIRSGASSAQTARQAGATYGQQVAYGLGSGALSVATEKISNVAGPFKKIFGEGILDKAISKAASKLTSSAAGRAALSFLSEGGEEVVEDLVQPILQQLTYKKGAMKEMLSTDFVAETLYDGLVGGTLGLLGSGAENLQRRGGTDTEQSQAQSQATPVQSQAQTQTQAETAQNRAETAPETQAAIERGTDAPATQNAAETILERNAGNAANAETAQTEAATRPEIQENSNPADMFSLIEQEARPQMQTDEAEANRQAAAAITEQGAPAVEETARAVQETQSTANQPPTVKTSGDPAAVEKMLKILQKGNRVDGDSLSNGEFDAAADAGAYMDADGKVYLADPESHIDNRSAADMGDRKVHAFQFDHPELHEYFLSAAQDLADDMDMSISYGVMHTTDRSTGVKRHTNKIVETPSIRKAMRTTGVTRDGIIEACKRIIADQGQDNVAAAKRVEIVLRDMLTYGYTRLDGTFVPPNEAYIRETRSIPGAKEAADTSTNVLLEMEDRREQWAAEEEQKTREWWDKVEQQSRERQAQKARERETNGQDGLGNADAGTVNTPFDAMQAESSEFHPVNPNSARSEVEQGIAPAEVPKVNPNTERNIEKTVSTILNAPMTSAEMKSVYENAIAEGSFDYDVATDADAVQASQERLNQEGWKDVATAFTGRVLLGQAVTKQDVSDAVAAYNAAVAAKDYETAFDVATALTESVHTSAQAVQAANLFNRLTPEGKLLTLRRLVDRMNDRAARKNGRTYDTQNNYGINEQESADLSRAMQESLDAAQSLVREIYEALQDRNGGHRRTLEEIISRFPQYRNLSKYFAEIDNYIYEERASGWVESLGRELAKNADQRANPKPVRERTVYETVSSDLNAFMRQYLDNRQQARKPRTAAERLTDFFNNRKEYAQAWNTAQNTLRSRYANNRDMLDRLEEFINGTIGYNARGSDAVMMHAVADAALQEDVKLKELVIRRRYDLDALSAQIADRLIQQTEAKGSDSIIIRDAVKRYVQEQYERNPKNTQQYIANDTKAAMHDFQITLSEILTQNIKSKNELANRISNALVQKYKISPDGAEAISNDIAAQFSDMVQEASRKKIEQLFQDKPKSVQKTAMQRFTEYANLGVFSTAHNEAATERLFGMQARIDPTLAESYVNAETDAERAAAWDAILNNLASQMPSTFKEKADFWRYASMLTNPTTHIRNLSGNIIQAGARKIKNGIGTMLERAAIRDKSGRTKSILTAKDKGLKDFAKAQYAADQEAAMGGGKYTEGTTAGIMREIESRRKAFNGDDALSRIVQGLGDFNTKLLDGEDVLFNKSAYVESFAQALKAKGVSEEAARAGARKADVEAARAYAIEEAARATYRNTTQFSEAVAQMGRYQGDNTVKKIGSLALDALLPFRKTPANILTTGIDYSPIGIAKAVAQMKSGTRSAADVIDSLSAGLTGTGILALGAYLASEGLLKVKAGDDDREEDFEKATGGQDFSVQIGNKTYTLDWAVPAAMPLFAGAAIMESVEDGGGTLSAVLDAMAGTSQVVMETSMLSSLDDLLSGWSYADDKMWYLTSEAATTYASQYLPNLGGKLASALDDTVRKSYVGKGTGELASDAEYFAQGVAKKIPGLRNTLQPSVDLWGNEVSNGSVGERLFQNFVSPGTLKTIDDSAATQEVKRLAEATGSHSVYPSAADKSFTLNGEDRNLTAEEYTQYAKTLGTTRKDLIESVVNNATYKGMSDEEKATVVETIYKYANYTARMELEPSYANEVDAWVLHAKNAQSELGISTADYLALYQEYGSSMLSGSGFAKTQQAVNAGLTVQEYAQMKEGLDADGNGSVSQKEAQQYLNGTKYSRSQKADLWALINKGWKKNPYE